MKDLRSQFKKLIGIIFSESNNQMNLNEVLSLDEVKENITTVAEFIHSEYSKSSSVFWETLYHYQIILDTPDIIRNKDKTSRIKIIVDDLIIPALWQLDLDQDLEGIVTRYVENLNQLIMPKSKSYKIYTPITNLNITDGIPVEGLNYTIRKLKNKERSDWLKVHSDDKNPLYQKSNYQFLILTYEIDVNKDLLEDIGNLFNKYFFVLTLICNNWIELSNEVQIKPLNVFDREGTMGYKTYLEHVLPIDIYDIKKQNNFQSTELQSKLDEFETLNLFDRSTPEPLWMLKYIESFRRTKKYDKFLDLSICLESIFGEQGETTHKISTRSAKLIGKSFTIKVDIKNRIKKLYSIRSKIVHGVSLDVTEENINEFNIYLKQIFYSILKKYNGIPNWKHTKKNMNEELDLN